MSTPMYEPLQAVPPITEQHVRMAWLLEARQAAGRALDAVLAAPRRPAGYLGRLAHKLHLDAALSWLRRTALYVTRPLTSAAQHLGRSGLVAAIMAVVTSPTGRAVVDSAARTLGTLLSWAARTTYSGLAVDCAASARSVTRSRTSCSRAWWRSAARSPRSPRRWCTVARLSDPATPQARLRRPADAARPASRQPPGCSHLRLPRQIDPVAAPAEDDGVVAGAADQRPNGQVLAGLDVGWQVGHGSASRSA